VGVLVVSLSLHCFGWSRRRNRLRHVRGEIASRGLASRAHPLFTCDAVSLSIPTPRAGGGGAPCCCRDETSGTYSLTGILLGIAPTTEPKAIPWYGSYLNTTHGHGERAGPDQDGMKEKGLYLGASRC